MADERDDTERSEDPTPKRLEEALKRGDVVKSQEVSTWFVIAGGTLVLMAFAAPMATSLQATLRGLLANAAAVRTDGHALVGLAGRIGLEVLASVAIPLLLLALAAAAGSLIQHRPVFTAQPLRPTLAKISPAAGLKRLFSKQALANFAKGCVKLVLIGAVMTALLWPERRRLVSLAGTDPAAVLPLARTLALHMLGAVVAILAVVAAADYLFQFRVWYDRQKMSLREVKEEFRQTEGDPFIKGKLRQLRMARMRKRMMAAVPKASVVITNPTHFAVALQYERGMNAPVCLAKGADLIARRIRDLAERHGIPVVQNPPLARALYGTVEVDQEIPPEHYRAVAEIIGYVMRLRRAVGR
jgi:flagellar biosynthetic protein FlhB